MDSVVIAMLSCFFRHLLCFAIFIAIMDTEKRRKNSESHANLFQIDFTAGNE